MSTEAADQRSLARWYRCAPCDVTWRDTTTLCWACEGEATERSFPHLPPGAARQAPQSETATDQRLTRFGTRVAGI